LRVQGEDQRSTAEGQESLGEEVMEAVEAVESRPSRGRGRESARGLQKARKAGRKVGSDRTDEFSFQ
jgi:hypothetical protein